MNQLLSERKVSPFIIVATVSCFIACIGDFAVTFIIGYLFPNYDFLSQSQSYLGTDDSPVAHYMNAWGVIFSVLFIVYAVGLRRSIFSKGRWQLIAVWLIIIYALGEGVGSGLFPYNHVGSELTFSGILHSIFSAIGVAALAMLPFAVLKIFPNHLFPKLNLYARFVGISGLILIVMFLLARQNLIPLKGLWQRLFILVYYILMMAVATMMKRFVKG
jgi:hypothetical protein